MPDYHTRSKPGFLCAVIMRDAIWVKAEFDGTNPGKFVDSWIADLKADDSRETCSGTESILG